MEIISKHVTEDHKGYATVNFDSKSQQYEIKFYDEGRHLFYTELREHLEDAQKFADDWTVGIEKFFSDAAA